MKEKKIYKKHTHRVYEDDENEFVTKNRFCVDKKGRTVPVELSDLTLHVRVEKGTEQEVDINCDSAFMLNSVDDIGVSIRDAFHWVPRDVPIILFMDNAGGHGSDVAKEQYVRHLKLKYNVVVEWQVPQSPETNLLDLGFWMTLQSKVEYLHKQRRMDSDSLALSVREAFNSIDGYTTLANIAKRWEVVLDLILEGKGSNDLVEKRRYLKKSLEPVQHVGKYADDDDGDDTTADRVDVKPEGGDEALTSLPTQC